MTSKYNFKIDKGTDYHFSVRFQDCEGNPLNLQGFRVKMQIRKGYSSNTVIDELSIANGRIENSSYEIDGVYDTLDFDFPSSVTQEYPAGMFLYDVQVQSSNLDITKVMEGQIQCLASVTQ